MKSNYNSSSELFGPKKEVHTEKFNFQYFKGLVDTKIKIFN